MPKTKNTGHCGRYMTCYWKWQMAFHVSLTSSWAFLVPVHSITGYSSGSVRGWRTRKSIVMQQWPSTVRECLASAYVLRTHCSKPQWTSVHERFKATSITNSPQDVLLRNTNRMSRPVESTVCCVLLLTLCCVRNVSPCTRKHAQPCIKLDRWVKRLYYGPCQFSSNDTWQWDTYSAVSRDTLYPLKRGSAKDMALCVYIQLTLSSFDRCILDSWF